MRHTVRVIAVAMALAAGLAPAYGAPGPVGLPGVAGEAGRDGAVRGPGDDRAYRHLVASPRREKHCKDAATGASGAAKDKSYKECIKNWR